MIMLRKLNRVKKSRPCSRGRGFLKIIIKESVGFSRSVYKIVMGLVICCSRSRPKPVPLQESPRHTDAGEAGSAPLGHFNQSGNGRLTACRAQFGLAVDFLGFCQGQMLIGEPAQERAGVGHRK